MKQYTVEFYDSYQGTCLMDVEAKSEKAAMAIVNKLLGRRVAIAAYHCA